MVERLLSSPFFLQTAMLGFIVAALSYAVGLFKKERIWPLGGSLGVLVGLVFVSLLIAGRWIEAGRPPFKTLYESLLFFIWCTALVYLVAERYARIPVLGLLTSLFVLGCFGYAVVEMDAEILNLPAALQSPWFIPHVVVYFLGYAALFIACVGGLVSLLSPGRRVTLRHSVGDETISYFDLMHKAVTFGFILLTAGLLVGALWAKTAWGDYWGWDPKENWSLISWLIYAIYFHLRRIKGWNERRLAFVCVLGFVAILVTYLGIHLLPTAEQSAHVYQ